MLREEKKNEEQAIAAPRCRMGSKTDNPCWRDAVKARYLNEDELTLCAEHARVMELNLDLERWYMNLYAIDQWVRGPVAEARDEDLERLAYNTRDEARREYGRIAIRARAARMVADREPPKLGEGSLTVEQE